MKIYKYVVGSMGTNCYIVTDETQQAIIIDPGYDSNKLISALVEKNLQLKYIVLTHCHFDHIMAVNEIMDYFHPQLAYSANDIVLAENPDFNLSKRFASSPYIIKQPDVKLKENDSIVFGNTTLNVIETPGHTEGSICLINENERIIFCGDTIFKGCIGRYDFSTGDYKKIMESVNKISELNGNYKLYPGHDSSTYLDDERQNSIYFS